jgi:hypothetical protein
MFLGTIWTHYTLLAVIVTSTANKQVFTVIWYIAVLASYHFSNLILNNIQNTIDAIIELENSIISMILASARLINSPSSENPINLPSPKNTAKNTPIERTILIMRILFILTPRKNPYPRLSLRFCHYPILQLRQNNHN